MKSNIAAAVAVGLILCSWAGRAEAFQYVFHGTVTETSNDQNINADYLKNQAVTITIDGNSADAFYNSAQETDLAIALQHASLQVGGDRGYFTNSYPWTSLVQNNGTTSSIDLTIGTSFNQFGPFQQAADGGLMLTAASGLANIPVDPEQSFGPTGVSGSGRFYAVPFGSVGGYSVSFSLTSLQGIGTVSAVPLPATAPLFGAALLAVAGLGCGARRRAALPEAGRA